MTCHENDWDTLDKDLNWVFPSVIIYKTHSFEWNYVKLDDESWKEKNISRYKFKYARITKTNRTQMKWDHFSRDIFLRNKKKKKKEEKFETSTTCNTMSKELTRDIIPDVHL